ncbi:MAG: alanine racemase [Clostridiales bacterium]|nr:alanine racemase [Clostridiales bacterium]
MRDYRRTWAEVNLSHAAHNFNELKRFSKSEHMIAVVKANAYGHGALTLARLYEKLGAEYLAVACVSEAAALREAGITRPILILGPTPYEYMADIIENNITQAVCGLEYARTLSRAAQKLEKTCDIHIKIDTGMTRLGIRVHDENNIETAARDIIEIITLPNLRTHGIFTHFSDADNPDKEYTERQFSLFSSLISRLQGLKISFPLIHCANSAAILYFDKSHTGCIRPGISLYGPFPGDFRPEGVTLKPVMSFKSRVGDIRIIKPGDSVSYCRRYTAERETKVAVVTAGYADGIRRELTNKGSVLINGRHAGIIGTVCMDMCIADITDLPDVKPGDTVTFFGEDSGACIELEEVARVCGTISNELLCMITSRVPRVYINE